MKIGFLFAGQGSQHPGMGKDFYEQYDAARRLYDSIRDPQERGRLSIMNTARSGVFAADRAIREYAENIWNLK